MSRASVRFQFARPPPSTDAQQSRSRRIQRVLRFTSYVCGFGAGIFFLGYCLFEVPSNLLLHRLGGWRWISRIMITWGLLAGATAFVHSAVAFCTLRFLLGVAEAGFFPGVIYYLTHWVPAARRARVVGAFMTAIPISTAVGGPLSSAILALGLCYSGVQVALYGVILGVPQIREMPASTTPASVSPWRHRMRSPPSAWCCGRDTRTAPASVAGIWQPPPHSPLSGWSQLRRSPTRRASRS
jgi:MFS family permease